MIISILDKQDHERLSPSTYIGALDKTVETTILCHSYRKR